MRRERSERRPESALGRGALFVLALFATTAFTSPSRAQETSRDDNVVGIEGVDFTDRNVLDPFAALGAPFEDDRSRNLVNTSQARNESEETGEDEIVVTAVGQNKILVTPHPDDVISTIERLGMSTIENPENAGLEGFVIPTDEIEHWQGARFEPFDTPDFITFSAEIKRGAGFRVAFHY